MRYNTLHLCNFNSLHATIRVLASTATPRLKIHGNCIKVHTASQIARDEAYSTASRTTITHRALIHAAKLPFTLARAKRNHRELENEPLANTLRNIQSRAARCETGLYLTCTTRGLRLPRLSNKR